jgi:signal transduction histidine kinase
VRAPGGPEAPSPTGSAPPRRPSRSGRAPSRRTGPLEDTGSDDSVRVPVSLPDAETASTLGAPIVVNHEPWGVLELRTTEPRSFDEAETTFVGEVAAVLGSALSNHLSETDVGEVYGRIWDACFALDEEGEEFIDYAVDGAERMREMIRGLLGYSRVETRGDPFESLDLNEVVETVRRDLEVGIEESEAELDVDDFPRVVGDAGQLGQVYQNLLENAIQYSGAAPPSIEITAERADGMRAITVSDEGIGIAPEDQERVFEVSQRLYGLDEHLGTGIGLALCERIVERHGGEI